MHKTRFKIGTYKDPPAVTPSKLDPKSAPGTNIA